MLKGDDPTTFMVPKVEKIRSLSLPEPLEPLRPIAGQLYLLLLTKYYSGDQIKNTEIGKAFSTYGGEEWCTQGFGREI